MDGFPWFTHCGETPESTGLVFFTGNEEPLDGSQRTTTKRATVESRLFWDTPDVCMQPPSKVGARTENAPRPLPRDSRMEREGRASPVIPLPTQRLLELVEDPTPEVFGIPKPGCLRALDETGASGQYR